MRRGATEPTPPVFSSFPSREQVIAAVNANTQRVEQLQTIGARLSKPGLPSLRASINYERPRRFRLLADTGLTGAEIDLGSNDELFWLWIKRDRPRAVYFSRHDQFAGSAARQIVPIEPQWLIEALGLVQIDPAGRHEGPTPRRDGTLELRSLVPSAEGPLTRLLVIDGTRGWVLEQHVYDVRGRRLASALASRHQYDPTSGTSLPRHIEIHLPPSGMSLTLDVAGYSINQLAGDPQQLWTMPQPRGYPVVDLADPRLRVPAQVQPPAEYSAPAAAQGYPRYQQPRYPVAPSGYTPRRGGRLFRRW